MAIIKEENWEGKFSINKIVIKHNKVTVLEANLSGNRYCCGSALLGTFRSTASNSQVQDAIKFMSKHLNEACKERHVSHISMIAIQRANGSGYNHHLFKAFQNEYLKEGASFRNINTGNILTQFDYYANSIKNK